MSVFLGRKLGMTTAFRADGRAAGCTVVELQPCKITALRTPERDGYSAVQLAFGKHSAKKFSKPLAGQLKAAGYDAPPEVIREFRVNSLEGLSIGDQRSAAQISVGAKVSVSGISRGKGFAGAMKRHGFHGGPKSHGQSDRWRAPGSVGSTTFPGRVWPGQRMAGRHGGKRVTVKNLEVVAVDAERHLVWIEGALPGPPRSIVEMRIVS